jgi:hypothetical protein
MKEKIGDDPNPLKSVLDVLLVAFIHSLVYVNDVLMMSWVVIRLHNSDI